LWGTYDGGSDVDWVYGLTWAKGGAYITGSTQSTGNMATPGAYKTTLTDTVDAFLAKFSGDGTLLWGTYYGGETFADAVCSDSAGNAYITGWTGVATNIATPGAYQEAYGGGEEDCFIAKFNDSGTALVWGTYYGGSGGDVASGITNDKEGNVYIAGSTNSMNGIATPGAYKTYLGGYGDAFLAKFTDNGEMVWATYYGGDSAELANGIAICNAGNVYIAGGTASTDSIATGGAYQHNYSDNGDAFVAGFSSGGCLLWGTYFGADEEDYASCILYDNAGHFYIAGNTFSPRGIATAGAYDTIFSGGVSYVGFIVKFDTVPTTGLPQINAATGAINIFPDPAHDFVTVSWQGIGQQGLQISISDMAGQQVYSAPVAAGARAATISVAGLPAGVYVLRATDATGNVMVGKMVKE